MEHITIIGAGMGGLTAALGLQRAGFKVSVYEQAKALGEVGAGFTVGPNAMFGLDYLDVGADVRAAGTRVQESSMRHWRTNAIISHQTHGVSDAEKALPENQYYHLHRADMHAILTAAVRAHDPNAIKLGHEFANLVQDASGVTVTFKTGVSIATQVLIGADGGKSAVRHNAFDHVAPQFAGSVAFRGLVPVDKVDPACLRIGGHISMGRRQMFMRYPVRNNTMINFVGNVVTSDWQMDGWNTPATVSEIMHHYEDWHEEVTGIIQATPEGAGIKWALVHRPPLKSYVNGRVVLVGDAAHTLTPFLGQGAAMAMEDGVVLSRCIQDTDDIKGALALYDRARADRGNWVMEESRRQAGRFLIEDPEKFDNATTGSLHEEILSYNPATVSLM